MSEKRPESHRVLNFSRTKFQHVCVRLGAHVSAGCVTNLPPSGCRRLCLNVQIPFFFALQSGLFLCFTQMTQTQFLLLTHTLLTLQCCRAFNKLNDKDKQITRKSPDSGTLHFTNTKAVPFSQQLCVTLAQTGHVCMWYPGT